jgi:hypothetical protein
MIGPLPTVLASALLVAVVLECALAIIRNHH